MHDMWLLQAELPGYAMAQQHSCNACPRLFEARSRSERSAAVRARRSPSGGQPSKGMRQIPHTSSPVEAGVGFAAE